MSRLVKFWLVACLAMLLYAGTVWGSGGDVVFDYAVQKVEKLADRDWGYRELAFASLEMKDFDRALGYYSRIEGSDFYNVLEELILHCRRETDFKRLAYEIERLEQPLSKAMTYCPLATLSLKLKLGDETRAEILKKFRELEVGKKEEDVMAYWGIAVRLCSIINDGAHQKAVGELMTGAKTLIKGRSNSRNYMWLLEEYNRGYAQLFGKLDEEVFEIWRKEVDGDFSETVKLIMFLREFGELERARQLLTQAIHRLPDEGYSAKNFARLSEGLYEVKVTSDESTAQFLSSDAFFIDTLVGCMPSGQKEPNPDLRALVFKSVFDFLVKNGFESQVEKVLSTFEKGAFLDFCHDLILYFHTIYLENDPQVTLENAANICPHTLAIDLAIEAAKRFRRLKQSPGYTRALSYAADRLKKERNDCFLLENHGKLVKECIIGGQMEFAEEVMDIDSDDIYLGSLPYLVGTAYLERDNLDNAQTLLARLPKKNTAGID